MSELEKKIRIGTLSGSLRRGSFNNSLARALSTVAPERVDVIALPSIGTMPHFDQDVLDADGIPESVQIFSQAIEDVDAVIIVSPEYNWSIPGTLKNALDWVSRLKPHPLVDKPAAIMTSSPGLLGGARAHGPIRNVLTALDCRIMAKPEVQISKIMTKISANPSAITDPETDAFLRQHLIKFAAFVRQG